MEEGQGLCRGWFVSALFQVKMHPFEIAYIEGEKENGFNRGSPNVFFCVYQHERQRFTLRRLEDRQ